MADALDHRHHFENGMVDGFNVVPDLGNGEGGVTVGGVRNVGGRGASGDLLFEVKDDLGVRGDIAL